MDQRSVVKKRTYVRTKPQKLEIRAIFEIVVFVAKMLSFDAELLFLLFFKLNIVQLKYHKEKTTFRIFVDSLLL